MWTEVHGERFQFPVRFTSPWRIGIQSWNCLLPMEMWTQSPGNLKSKIWSMICPLFQWPDQKDPSTPLTSSIKKKHIFCDDSANSSPSFAEISWCHSSFFSEFPWIHVPRLQSDRGWGGGARANSACVLPWRIWGFHPTTTSGTRNKKRLWLTCGNGWKPRRIVGKVWLIHG